jgi:hypothetical protein
LKPGNYFLLGSIQGLKPGAFKLWVNNWVQQRAQGPHLELPQRRLSPHVVAAQVEFESQNFETSFSLYRLKG